MESDILLHRFDYGDFILQTNLQSIIDNPSLSNLLDNIKKGKKSIVSNVKSWHYGWHVHKEYEQFKHLSEIIEKISIEEILKKEWSTYKDTVKLQFYESWVIDYTMLGFTQEHRHYPNVLASSYYIEVVGEVPCPLIFTNLIKERKNIEFELQPKTGDLFIFPGHLNHKVKAVGYSKKLVRKVFAGNLIMV